MSKFAIKRSDIQDTCMLWTAKERFYINCIPTCTSVNPHSTLANSNSGLMQCKSVVWPQVFRIRRSRDTNMLLSLKIRRLLSIICCKIKLNELRDLEQVFQECSLYKQGVNFYNDFVTKLCQKSLQSQF